VSRTVAPDFRTVAEAAILLAVSRQHIYDLIERGELVAYRLGEGGVVRIPIPALLALQRQIEAA
jgi:excisionase family DNA binding protein